MLEYCNSSIFVNRSLKACSTFKGTIYKGNYHPNLIWFMRVKTMMGNIPPT